jgi:predicted CxxxxCH...CXXCH cytochrome family protein
VDVQGRTVATNVSVGVHASHVATTLAAPIACVQCHPSRTASVITDTSHVDGNGIAEVAFGALAKTGNVTPVYARTSATAATCASTYCHGNFTGGPKATMSWTSTAQATCTTCHGAPPTTGHHTSVSSHKRSCGDCHGAGYTTTAVVPATHVDGVKQLGNKIRTYNPTTRTCTSSCHGSQTW